MDAPHIPGGPRAASGRSLATAWTAARRVTPGAVRAGRASPASTDVGRDAAVAISARLRHARAARLGNVRPERKRLRLPGHDDARANDLRDDLPCAPPPAARPGGSRRRRALTARTCRRRGARGDRRARRRRATGRVDRHARPRPLLDRRRRSSGLRLGHRRLVQEPCDPPGERVPDAPGGQAGGRWRGGACPARGGGPAAVRSGRASPAPTPARRPTRERGGPALARGRRFRVRRAIAP